MMNNYPSEQQSGFSPDSVQSLATQEAKGIRAFHGSQFASVATPYQIDSYPANHQYWQHWQTPRGQTPFLITMCLLSGFAGCILGVVFMLILDAGKTPIVVPPPDQTINNPECILFCR